MAQQVYHYSRFATEEGNPSNVEASGDYSAAPTKFITRFEEGRSNIVDIARVIVLVKSPTIITDGFFGIAAPGLTNGIRIVVEDAAGNLIEELTDPLAPIQRTWHWPAYCFDDNALRLFTGDQFMVLRWTFTRFGDGIASPVRLFREKNQRIAVILNDDFTGGGLVPPPVTAQRFMFQGVYK